MAFVILFPKRSPYIPVSTPESMDSSTPKILVLGAYGGVGKALCREILQKIPAELSVAGRNLQKVQNLVRNLQAEFSGSSIRPVVLDARDSDQLMEAFQNVDLAIITATIPDLIADVAKAALATHTDVIDILLRGDVVDRLRVFDIQAKKEGRTFITQGGFHPGMIAPAIRLGKNKFDAYLQARVFMAMDGIFRKPESSYELFHELLAGGSRILENGKWRKANWKDSLEVDFSGYFGKRSCFPLQMREMEGLERELGLREMGTYAAGFDRYIDNVIFPLILLLGYFNKKMAIKLGGNMLFRHIRKNLDKAPRVEFRMEAKGLKDGREQHFSVCFESGNGFELTAQALIACLIQYLQGKIRPGVHLMGQVLDEKQMLEDLIAMGLEIRMAQQLAPVP